MPDLLGDSARGFSTPEGLRVVVCHGLLFQVQLNVAAAVAQRDERELAHDPSQHDPPCGRHLAIQLRMLQMIEYC